VLLLSDIRMTTWLHKLSTVAAQPSRIVVGLMSGTSTNDVDIAVCEIAGAGRGARVKLCHHGVVPYDPVLQAAVRSAASATTRQVAELHAALGRFFAEGLRTVITASGFALSGIDLIGSHGQTVYHHSAVPNAPRVTMQLGDGDVIAEHLSVAVISDFRTRDIAAGGEGAPLTPYADDVLFGSTAGRAVLNLGGIANITVLSADPSKVGGFDIGPANAPLDRLARLLTKGAKSFDPDGSLARRGTVRSDILQQLITSDPFLSRPPPKSSGVEVYGDPFVEQLIALHGGLSEDVLATATEFVAATVRDACRSFVQPVAPMTELVLAGGGARNLFLRERLAALLAPCRVRTSDELGVPAEAREAMAFALLANDALLGLPTSVPNVTGARRAAVLGKLSFPAA